jgi:hypothetical protein
MATSAVPDAIDALVEILGGAPGMTGVLIVDGPPAVNFSDRERIYVGHDREGESAADISQSFAGAGARTRDEEFSIACYAEVRYGDKNMARRRSRVFDLLAAVENALRATDANPDAPTLNGTVQWAHLTAGTLVQSQTGDGAVAGLSFTVTCRARI